MQKTFKEFLDSKSAPIVLPVVAIIVLFVGWEAIVQVFKVPTHVLPPLSSVFAAIVPQFQYVIKNSWFTFYTTMLGFMLAVITGVLLGFLIGYSKFAYLTLYPILVGFNTIPKVALVPLLAIWFGIGAAPAVITAFSLAFFPIAVNVAVGLSTVEPEMRDVLYSLGASDMEMFQKVGFPYTLPYLFASLKVAISLAFVGAVISETVASNAGVGYLIVSYASNFEVPAAFLCLLVLAIMGVILYTFFAMLETKLIPWAR